jgi:hypothetical protein
VTISATPPQVAPLVRNLTISSLSLSLSYHDDHPSLKAAAPPQSCESNMDKANLDPVIHIPDS